MADINYIIKEEGEEDVKISEEGFIDEHNIKMMSFEFRNPQDITESLDKKKETDGDEKKKQSVSRFTGRTAYAGLTVVYPSKEESSKVFVRNCILQYSPAVEKGKGYANNYIFIGIPEYFISRLMTDASKNSLMKLNVKDKVQRKSNFYWINCTLEKMPHNNIQMLYNESGETRQVPTKILTLLQKLKGHVKANVCFTISAISKTDEEVKMINVKNAQYKLTIKPTEMYLVDSSDVEAPTLPDLERRRNETIEASEKNMASDAIAKIALASLSISSTN